MQTTFAASVVDVVYVGTSSQTYVPNFRDSLFRRSAGPMDAIVNGRTARSQTYEESDEEGILKTTTFL